MKATFTVLAMLVAFSQAQAQTIQYDEATNTVVEVKQAPAAQPASPVAIAPVAAPAAPAIVVQQAPAPAAPVAAPAAQTVPSASAAITVITPAPIAAPVAQQPTTVIEETPVKDSRSELLKKARGQMEDHTERKIEEKLEEARIRDEKKRSDRVEGAIDASENQQQQQQPAPVAPVGIAAPVAAPTTEVIAPVAPVVVAPNAQAVVVPEAKVEEKKEEVKVESNEDLKPVVREELRSDMDRKEAKKEDKGQAYIGALGGVTSYSSASNIKANGAAGVEVGYITKNRIVIEGAFAYSAFDLQQQNGLLSQYPPYRDLNQYNTTVALKYQILPGMFRPYAGILASYTRRTYSQPNGSINFAPATTQDASSDAIDYGFTAGLDVEVASNFLVGVDFRYMTNLTNHVDDAYQAAYNARYAQGSTPVEELDYYSVGITAKLLF